MNLDTFFNFIIPHAETIFSATLALVLLLSGFLIYRNFFGNEIGTASEASPADLNRIEESLRKILSQTNASGVTGGSGEVTASTGPGAGPVANAGASDPQLRQEIEARTKQIEELKKQIEAAKGDDNTPELLAKIKNLEDRLTEYEIIEDDIADLSNYKEENARLKKELDNLKSGKPAASAAPPMPEPVTAQADLIEEFDEAVKNLEKQKPAEEAKPNPEDALAAAMEEASVVSGIVAEPPKAAEAPAAPAAKPAAAAEPAAQDIFAEMQSENAQAVDLLAELGDIDADRMLEEIKDLGEGMGDAGVLDEGLDMDKMASEVTGKKG